MSVKVREDMGEVKLPEQIEKRLRLRRLQPDLEPFARELVSLATTGSSELWSELSPQRMRLGRICRHLAGWDHFPSTFL